MGSADRTIYALFSLNSLITHSYNSIEERAFSLQFSPPATICYHLAAASQERRLELAVFAEPNDFNSELCRLSSNGEPPR